MWVNEMKAIQISSFGNPAEVAKLVQLPDPGSPGPGQVLIRMEYSPINPSDLLQIRGLYGIRPKLPATIGGEGIGKVLAIGAGVEQVNVGDRVLLPKGAAAWQNYVMASAGGLFVTSDGDPQQLSMLAVNPPTAALMLRNCVELAPGDWVIQNAGNSGVGRAVAAFARERGIRLISVVRREELIEELKACGSEAVLLEGRDLARRVAAITGKAPVKLGLDALAGEAGFSLATALAPGATLVVYAALSAKPTSVNPLDVIFRGISIRGFWLDGDNLRDKPAYLDALRDGAQLIAAGKLNVPITATYPLWQAEQAIAHAQAGGKILLDMAAS
jgi:mitochondrial enoyl-[acyl-carrier protein] reductase / trans-2-enoyl-CoA reductase